MTTLLITGGAGFIGSALIRLLLTETDFTVVNLDKLTYAGNLESLVQAEDCPKYHFERADICDAKALRAIIGRYEPSAVLHLAAESHVDRSIDGPAAFVQTNVVGTFTLLDEIHKFWRTLSASDRQSFRFVHVSTDEVFGSLGARGYFTERTPYQPNSPYSASKAGSDHLVRAWYHTYGLPAIITNCSNNYGPYQFPEKLIPLTIQNAFESKPLPVYGQGENIRDWLFVDDHVRALISALRSGLPGQTYAIGGNNEMRNIDVVHSICDLLDEFTNASSSQSHRHLVRFVPDRPGHDARYAIDASKVKTELGWQPRETFSSGLRKTVRWYIDNQDWVTRVLTGAYRRERLGLGATR